jgi:hypothetical protein
MGGDELPEKPVNERYCWSRKTSLTVIFLIENKKKTAYL